MGNANSGGRSHIKKYKRQANKTALALFGRSSRMETPEERETLALVLRLSDKNEFKQLAAQAMSPLYKGTSFAKLIEQHGLNIHSISSEIKDIQRSTGFLRAAMHLPDIMEETAIAAKSRDEQCKSCKGTGLVKELPCGKCEGKGTVRVLGDLERLKITLETFELLGKRAGLNLNLDLRKMPNNESMADLSASVAPLLEGHIK